MTVYLALYRNSLETSFKWVLSLSWNLNLRIILLKASSERLLGTALMERNSGERGLTQGSEVTSSCSEVKACGSLKWGLPLLCSWESRKAEAAWLVPKRGNQGSLTTMLPLLFWEVLLLLGGQSLMRWYTGADCFFVGPLGSLMTAGNFVSAPRKPFAAMS